MYYINLIIIIAGGGGNNCGGSKAKEEEEEARAPPRQPRQKRLCPAPGRSRLRSPRPLALRAAPRARRDDLPQQGGPQHQGENFIHFFLRTYD